MLAGPGLIPTLAPSSHHVTLYQESVMIRDHAQQMNTSKCCASVSCIRRWQPLQPRPNPLHALGYEIAGSIYTGQAGRSHKALTEDSWWHLREGRQIQRRSAQHRVIIGSARQQVGVSAGSGRGGTVLGAGTRCCRG